MEQCVIENNIFSGSEMGGGGDSARVLVTFLHKALAHELRGIDVQEQSGDGEGKSAAFPSKVVVWSRLCATWNAGVW